MSTRARHQTFNTQAAVPLSALLFPTNVSGSDTTAPFVALQFTNPHLNGLPIWGPSDTGVTVIREYTPIQQTGYFAAWWWSNNGGFLWSGGSSDSYWGFHPYPSNGSNTGTTHEWEVAGMDQGADYRTTNGGGPLAVVQSVKYVQMIRVQHNNPGGSGTKTATCYLNLPSTAAGNIIVATSPTTGFGNSNPPSPALTIGDSPWYADFQHERGAGYHGRYKVFSKVLTEANGLSEAADMSRLVTSEGQSNIWWGKTNWRTIDDLTCDYGTGRAWAWADAAHKATLVAAP